MNIGFGPVVKMVMEFTRPFWRDRTFRTFNNLDFLFTDAIVPTWWTQTGESKILTGWVGGPDLEKEFKGDEDYFQLSLGSLTYYFDSSVHRIKEMLTSWKVFQWLHDPYAKGAYTYSKPETSSAVKFLPRPFNETFYFSGEAIYDALTPERLKLPW